MYWKFNGIEQFEKLIRLHLTRQVQAWKSRADTTNTTGSLSYKQEPALTEDDEDEGILDLMDVFEDKFAELTEISQRIGAATHELGQKMTDRTAEMEELAKNAQCNANRKGAKRLIARAASDMTQFTARIEAELPLFRDAMNIGMNSFIKAATLSIDLNPDDDGRQQAKEGMDAMLTFRGMLATSKESMNQFRATMAALPRMTTDLNKAKRGATTALDRLLAEFTNGEVLVTESKKVIRGLLGESEYGT
jgi:exonuclease VII small subunit